ncbi:flagellar basal body-associated FliL family protein [Desulfocurvus sp.]|jgi:flagellar FliL protein|uniref:flagellar basal body-associated FliL family protein n=1 Tax=Desulfocurvus sp. TaxID=2871698 RepID=UPI0025BFE454|nr:flagellar basal body-associated FliL family protein [Desulfocurvus sp.]MCK9238894.1 flagellar basal body-associated FliL family protein [Desulfocurvus sp.]
MADEQLEAPKGGKKGGKLKWIIIAVVILALLGGAGFFLRDQIMGLVGMGPKAAEQGGEAQSADPAAAEAEPKDTELVSLPTFLVNLADPLGRRYLKLSMDVELRNKDAAEKIKKNEPKVRDAVNLLLSSKTFADLSSMESKLALKDEIVSRLNQIVGGSMVLRVYFTEMVVQ